MNSPQQTAEELAEKVASKLYLDIGIVNAVEFMAQTKELILTELNPASLLADKEKVAKLEAELLSRPEVCDGTGACPDGKCLKCQLVNLQLQLGHEKRANYYNDYAKAKVENAELLKDKEKLKIENSLFKANFSKYASWKANGIKYVRVLEITKEYEAITIAMNQTK